MLFSAGWEAKDKTSIVGGTQAKAAMEAFGFKEIELIGPILFGCDKNDVFRIEFKAISPGGSRVKAQACAGILFKGWTVRIDEVLSIESQTVKP